MLTYETNMVNKVIMPDKHRHINMVIVSMLAFSLKHCCAKVHPHGASWLAADIHLMH